MAGPPGGRWGRLFWPALALILLAAAFASRWPNRNGYFQVDDFLWLHLAHWRSVADSFAGPFGGRGGRLLAYRPIFRVSVYLDAFIFGRNAVWWHFENLAIHAANSLLLAAIARGFRLPRAICGAAALLFLFAPHNSESVDWISGRTVALCFLFMELAAWRWVWAVRDHRAPWAAMSWMLIAAGTYESAIALPFTLLCLTPLAAKSTGVPWPDYVRRTIPMFIALAIFAVLRGFLLGTPVGQTAPTDLNLLANSIDHYRALWQANRASGSAVSRWVLLAALVLTTCHPRLFPAGPCLLALANILLLPFITTPGAGSRFFYMLQAPLCVMAVLPMLLVPGRWRAPAVALLLALVLPQLILSSWREAEAFSIAGANTRALLEAVRGAVPKNIGYANVVDGVPELTNGRLMAGGFFETALSDTYHDPEFPPPFIARSETVLGTPEILERVLRIPTKYWRYDPATRQISPMTREAWLDAHPEAKATLPQPDTPP